MNTKTDEYFLDQKIPLSFIWKNGKEYTMVYTSDIKETTKIYYPSWYTCYKQVKARIWYYNIDDMTDVLFEFNQTDDLSLDYLLNNFHYWWEKVKVDCKKIVYYKVTSFTKDDIFNYFINKQIPISFIWEDDKEYEIIMCTGKNTIYSKEFPVYSHEKLKPEIRVSSSIVYELFYSNEYTIDHCLEEFFNWWGDNKDNCKEINYYN